MSKKSATFPKGASPKATLPEKGHRRTVKGGPELTERLAKRAVGAKYDPEKERYETGLEK